MQWSEKNVLITGSGGFIGSHLTEHLVNLNANVTGFLRYNSRNDWGLLEYIPEDTREQLTIIMGDLKDSDAVRNAIKGADIIFHLGSLIAIPYSYMHPRETVETNIMGTFNVLNAARESNAEKLVHTSTSEVYGTAHYVPIDEQHPLQGQSPYSASKIGADKIAESFHRSYGIPLAIIRPFNTYGPRQSARAVIPTIISQALNDQSIKLGSLKPTRDYTYVGDLVKAFVKMAESPRTVGEVINIGSNFEIAIGDLARTIIELMDKDLDIVTDPQRIRPKMSEVERLWCDNSKAKDLLGWHPSKDLKEGLIETIDWISDRPDLYKSKLYNI